MVKAFLCVMPLLVGSVGLGALISGEYMPYSGYAAAVFLPMGFMTTLLYLDGKL